MIELILILLFGLAFGSIALFSINHKIEHHVADCKARIDRIQRTVEDCHIRYSAVSEDEVKLREEVDRLEDELRKPRRAL